MKEIILASASPRRRELLKQIGIVHRVVPSLGDEVFAGGSPLEEVQNLARQKAEEVAYSLCLADQPVLGADTIVVWNGQILGKPKDEEEAFWMLNHLQGSVHQVYTGVALCLWQPQEEETKGAKKRGEDFTEKRIPSLGKIISHTFYEETKVEVYPMTEQEIRTYLATKDGQDKAGAYGIQGPFGAYIKRIEGDYYNVVGLPIGRVYQELKRFYK